MRLLRVLLVALLCLPGAHRGVLTRGQEAQAPPGEVKIDPKIFDAYVGQYHDDLSPQDVVFSFFREGDKFYVRATNRDRLEIFPSSETKFFCKAFPLNVEFLDGAAVVRIRALEFRAARISRQPAEDTRVPYARTEAMIAMRDGVKLYTVVLAPEGASGPLPILLNRTPYGVKRWDSAGVNAQHAELARERYIFAFQDIRGKGDSGGEFVMVRPPRDERVAGSVDESTDTYDTIDWLVKNVADNNGRLGIYGVSYDGWLSTVALIGPHPALRASSPQAPLTDAWIGDDFFHNGAFRQSIGHEYIKMVESSKGLVDVAFDRDAYDWYLSLPTLSKLTEQLGGRLPTWNAFVAHPNYDEFWQRRGAENYVRAAPVPTLVVGGWWDQEDLYGALKTYETLERYDREGHVFLVEGPWNHGGWAGRGRRLGDVDFGSDTGKYFREKIEAPWFAYYLKGRGPLAQAEATLFQSGSNRWMTYDEYPPRARTRKRGLYLQPGGRLSFERPRAGAPGGGYDRYVSDPSNPVPYRRRPVEATYDPKGSGWYTWLVQDQRFLKGRADVLSWKTEPLAEEVTITGDIVAKLFASTSGTDSDWVVKLIDVYPEDYPADAKMAGYQLMVACEIMRGRFSRSFEKPEPLGPGRVVEYTIDLRGNDYVFRKGHRIMVQVQSSWFPLYDRNPQTFVPNIFLAKEGDFRKADQRVYRSPKYPSRVEVSVAPALTASPRNLIYARGLSAAWRPAAPSRPQARPPRGTPARR